jgi:amino acid adenylation domain-containing protein
MSLSSSAERRTLYARMLAAKGLERASDTEIPRRLLEGHCLCSYAQQRLWLIEQLEAVGSAYHIHSAIRLHGVLDRDALVKALDTVVERHEVLRTVFRNEAGRAVQVIAPHERFALQEVDCSGGLREEQEAQVAREAREVAALGFDLSTGPLIRGRLLGLSTQEHVLLLRMHHIVSDGWSIGILVKELGALYAAYHEGRPNPLPPLSIQYADYGLWQRQWLQGERLQGQLGYWREQLQGAPVLLELPTDEARPAVQSYRGAGLEVQLGEGLSGQLRQLSQEHDVTLHMVLYAGFAVLLWRLSGQRDVVIGTPVANRERTQIEPLIGFFVNTLALRVQLDPGVSVSELLRQVKELTLQGYAHQEVPFEQVVEVLNPPRSLSHAPLFQAMLVLQNAPAAELRLPGLRLQAQASELESAQFDLMLSLQEVQGRIEGTLSYASDLFTPPTIRRWLEHFREVLRQMVGDARQRVGELSLLGEQDRKQVLEGFNATRQEYPQDRLIHELFEEQVRRSPAAVAVEYEGERLTYAQLNHRANQLARYLRGQGVRAEERVGICVERSLEMVVGLLGILKAGGAYVPLDPGYPPERLRYMLEDAGPRVLLTQGRLTGVLPAGPSEVLALDEQWERIACEEGGDLARAAGMGAGQLAYVIYTSGSTGKPKGVMIEHRSAANLICWARTTVDCAVFERTLFSTSLNFDLSVYECFVPLSMGGTVCLMGNLLELSQRPTPVTLINTVPSAMKALLETDRLPPTTAAVNLAGEALSRELVEEIFARSHVHRVCNLYGPSETTTYSTWVCMQAEDGFNGSIGKPIGNTGIYILDDELQPTPIGVSGEIYIGGAGLARGYLGRQALTAQRFVPDPFGTKPGARLYRTGDLGRWHSDGTIEYLGRNDHQVKIRGYRIELGEIEAQLSRHQQVKEVAVLSRDNGSRAGKELVAYFTAAGAVAPTPEELTTQLRIVLPEYMIPSEFVLLEALPLTDSGKLDRRALPTPNAERPRVEYVAPRNDVEGALAAGYAEVLKVDRVGIRDNFFDLGGNSLLLLTLHNRLVKRFAGLAVIDLLRFPDIEGLGRYLTGEPDTPLTLSPSFERGESRRRRTAALSLRRGARAD